MGDVFGFFPGMAVCKPFLLRFESEIAHECARFFEGPHFAAIEAVVAKPVAPTDPTRFGISLRGIARKVFGFLA